MKSTVYIETSVIGYLAARMSRDMVVAGHQQITQEWWDARDDWKLYASRLVVEEATRGDPWIGVNVLVEQTAKNPARLAKRQLRSRNE